MADLLAQLLLKQASILLSGAHTVGTLAMRTVHAVTNFRLWTLVDMDIYVPGTKADPHGHVKV